MAIIGVFRCADIDFDIHDSERIPIGLSAEKYYITPKKIDLVEQWLTTNNLEKVETKEQVELLISLKLIGTYKKC